MEFWRLKKRGKMSDSDSIQQIYNEIGDLNQLIESLEIRVRQLEEITNIGQNDAHAPAIIRSGAQRRATMKLSKLLWTYIKHWFGKVDNKYEHKPRFSPCVGCRDNLKEWKRQRSGRYAGEQKEK